MPSEKIELPPMPEPAEFRVSLVGSTGDGFVVGRGHSDEAMTAYALLAVNQEREQLCDQLLTISARWDWPVRDLLKETLAAIRQSS